MLNNAIGRVVAFCTRFAWAIIGFAVILSVACSYYAARHFAINTDVAKLISPDLPWREREIDFEKVFPQTFERILAVVQAPTPELAAKATHDLADKRGTERPVPFGSGGGWGR